MAKPAMTQCCCCCGDLRIGSMAILVIQSVLAMITIISAISTLSSGNYIDGDNEERNRIIMNSRSNNEFDMKNYMHTKTSLIIQVTFGLLAILFNAIGFYGCYKKVHNYILPWVVYNGIVHSLNIILILVMSILIGIALGGGMGFGVFVVCSIVLAVFIYMWCVVYSYYAVLQEENNRGLYDKQPYRR